MDQVTLTVQEAAELLGVSPATLRNWDNAGKLKAHRHPINGYRLYSKEDILRLRDEIQMQTKTQGATDGQKQSD